VTESGCSHKQNHKGAYDIVKVKNQSRKQRHELDRIRVGRIRTCLFSSDFTYDSAAYNAVKTRLLGSKVGAEG